jgi:hopene-associated glycosyltransferase HpnB
LLIPAFVFFFAMLYPFRQSDDPDSPVAAAAGGVMLVRRRALDNIGGLNTIKAALIDDCSLAHAIKIGAGDLSTSGKIELSLSNDVKSLRIYSEISDIWQMVARTAFTQLRLSPLRLIGTVAGMSLLFLVPTLVPTAANFWPSMLGMMAWIIMSLIYLPSILFYRLPWYWTFTLPGAAVIYIAATIDSARLYWKGQGGNWKGRAQA